MAKRLDTRVTALEATAGRRYPGPFVHVVDGEIDWHGTFFTWVGQTTGDMKKHHWAIDFTTPQAIAALVVMGHTVAREHWEDTSERRALLASLPRIFPAVDTPEVLAWKAELEAIGCLAREGLTPQQLETVLESERAWEAALNQAAAVIGPMS